MYISHRRSEIRFPNLLNMSLAVRNTVCYHHFSPHLTPKHQPYHSQKSTDPDCKIRPSTNHTYLLSHDIWKRDNVINNIQFHIWGWLYLLNTYWGICLQIWPAWWMFIQWNDCLNILEMSSVFWYMVRIKPIQHSSSCTNYNLYSMHII